jgi:hypothetical protein
MATYKPELHSLESVLSYFDQYDEPAFQVFAGHKPEAAYCRFTYTGNDKGVGREKLYEALQSVVSNPDNTNTYLLQIISVKGKKIDPINSITFQLNKPNQYLPIQSNYNNNSELLNKLNAIEHKLALLEYQEEEEEEEEQSEKMQGIGALFNNPQVQQMLVQGIINMFTPVQGSAVAGINESSESEKIKIAIEILQKSVPDLGDKLQKLADMSINEKIKFQMLIKML